jgi:hypothetical protein
MILRRDGTDWLYINQLDHSRLAGRLMAAWQADGFPGRPTRAKVLQATSDHDLGWQIPDAVPRIGADGQPYDFVSAPLEIKQPPFGRAVETLTAEDPYVAALVAQHAITVYRRYASEPAWQGFFGPLESRRDDLVAAAVPGGFESFLQDYALVGLGDPFAGATVALEVVARRIPARVYASDQDLRETLAQAVPERVTGVAIGAPLPPIA